MTTIAWDGETLCADRMGCRGGLKYETQKLFEIENGQAPHSIHFFAWTGDHQDAIQIRHWLEGKEQEKPKFEPNSGSGIFIDREGKAFRMESKLVRLEILGKFDAVGSGRDFAIAAMHLGKCAIEAVGVAALFDDGTGFGINASVKRA